MAKRITKEEVIASLDMNGGIDFDCFEIQYYSYRKPPFPSFDEFVADLVRQYSGCTKKVALEVVQHYKPSEEDTE